jgi:hypothetical protein
VCYDLGVCETQTTEVMAVAAQTPYERLTPDQVTALEEAARPLWEALDAMGWTDAFGGAEFGRVFPETVNFVHASSNLGPYQTVEFAVTDHDPAL